MGRKKFTRERPRAALSPPICPGHAFVFYDAEWQLMQKNKKNRIVNQGHRFQLVRLRRGSYVWILCLKARSLRERLRDALSLPPQL